MNIDLTTLIAWATGIITLASLVANLTPNDTDNKIVDVIKKIVDVLALNIKKKK